MSTRSFPDWAAPIRRVADILGIVLLTGLSAEEKNKGLPRAIGLPIALALAVVVALAGAWFASIRLDESLALTVSTALAVGFFALLGVGILAQSRPDWRRVLLGRGLSSASHIPPGRSCRSMTAMP